MCKWKPFFVYSVSFFDMDTGVFGLLTGCGFAFLGVGCGQPDADSVFINREAQTAVFIVLDQLTKVGICGGIGSQVLFEFGVVGVDLGGAVVFVEIQFGYLSFLLGDLFHKTFLSLVRFPGSRDGKSGLKFDSDAWSDAMVVPGFSVGYKADFYIVRTCPKVSAASFLCYGSYMGICVQSEPCGEMVQHIQCGCVRLF